MYGGVWGREEREIIETGEREDTFIITKTRRIHYSLRCSATSPDGVALASASLHWHCMVGHAFGPRRSQSGLQRGELGGVSLITMASEEPLTMLAYSAIVSRHLAGLDVRLASLMSVRCSCSPLETRERARWRPVAADVVRLQAWTQYTVQKDQTSYREPVARAICRVDCSGRIFCETLSFASRTPRIVCVTRATSLTKYHTERPPGGVLARPWTARRDGRAKDEKSAYFARSCQLKETHMAPFVQNYG